MEMHYLGCMQIGKVLPVCVLDGVNTVSTMQVPFCSFGGNDNTFSVAVVCVRTGLKIVNQR